MKNDSHIKYTLTLMSKKNMKLGWRMLLAIRRGKVAFSETMSSLLSDAMYKNNNKMDFLK